MEYNKTQDITITSDQIAHLFKFVKSKYVRYIDLQYELVDHLASAIEDEMAQDSKLTFEQALALVYNRFPVTGFTHYIKSTSTNLSKYWRRKLWLIAKSYFRIPQVILTIAVFAFVLYICFEGDPLGIKTLLTISIIVNFVASHFITSKFLNRKYSNNYLFLSSFHQAAFGLSMMSVYFFLNFPNWDFEAFSSFQNTLIATAITALLIYSHAIATYFPSMIKEEIKIKYAHLKLVID